ncbi:MAG TPA: rhodanese-like domain-containing protein [Candidatus Ozemobacteraceae bacterium]|nr:rhodanese-like domain-containing protein [Candidatus Ozemobacteraceae bacterium]HQG29195.1 rhodanese-like domain-containing protein [Candidatus Ozemobacteraceae bacterium]
MLFLIGSILGSILFNELFEHVRPLYTLGLSGTVHIFDTLGITKGAFALLFTATGVAAFWLSELIEARIAAKRARFRGRSSAHPGMAPPFPREAVCTFFRRRLPTGFHRGNEAGADLDGTARPAFFRRRSLGHRHAAPAGIQHVAYSGLGIAQPGKPPRRQGRRSVNSASGRPVARQFGAMGIVPETHVVIVHGDKLHDETLVAIALERLGHTRYSILDGGWARWKAENRPADFYTRARSDEARAGHIPGARNRPFSSDLASGTVGVSLKPLTDLAEAYEKLVGDRHARLIVHCRTGHQASQTWFVLRRLLGYENVAWYDGGWTEWAARTEFPIETGVK